MLILFLEGSRAGTVAEVPFVVARDLLAAGRARRPDEIVLTMQREASPEVAALPRAKRKR